MKKIWKLCSFCLLLLIFTGCNQEKKVENSNEKNGDVEKKLTCEDGYILKEKSCYKEIENKDATEVYSCRDGYILSDDSTVCQKVESIDANKKLSCKSGYNLNGDKCFGTSTKKAVETYRCPNGGSLKGSKCIKTVADLQALSYKYFCVMGYLSGERCLFSPGPATGRCPTGSTQIDSRTCARDALKEYYCLRGEQIGNMCYVDVATSADVSYSCQSGYTLKGNQCLKNVSVDATVDYVCDSGYTLKGKTCIRIVEIDRIVNYRCDERYELKEKTCVLYDVKGAVEK